LKRSRAFACLFGVFALASPVVVSPGVAQAATCQYNRQDLPVPAGSGHVSTMGSSTNNSRVVGQVMKGQFGRGAYWVNSALREMAAPASSGNHTIPYAINNTSVVAGFEQEDRGLQMPLFKAFRYENGAYQFLETDAGYSSKAYAINDAGDVLGFQFSGTNQFSGDVYLWPRTGARKRIYSGTPIGITAQRKIVVDTGWVTVVIDADSGAVLELPENASYVTLDNDHVFQGVYGDTGEWNVIEYDLNGVPVATHPGAMQAFGRNGSGTVFGKYQASTGPLPALWRKSGRTDVVADHLPFDSTYSDITDAATLIGTYSGADNVARPSRWLWVCS
jgi:hypothetical protein